MKRDDKGGIEVSVKNTRDEEIIWFEIGAQVAIKEGIVISEIKRRRGKEK